MKRKIKLLLGLVFLGGLLWYLFIKPYDYLVTFKSRALPGTIDQTIKLWANSLDGSEIITQKRIGQFEYQFKFNDSVHHYKWHIAPLNDSISKIKVYVTAMHHGLWNKLKIPFSDTDFEKRTRKMVIEQGTRLNEHLDRIKVELDGVDTMKPKYCVYVALKSTQLEKAKKMMEYFPLLDDIVTKNKLKPNGRPFLEVTHWDTKTDSIHFNFCLPIIPTDSLPHMKAIQYKEFKGGSALKATYHGNYITSDRAWYTLVEQAKKENTEVVEKPVEVFHSNPNLGGNELSWKAEIFMPLKH